MHYLPRVIAHRDSWEDSEIRGWRCQANTNSVAITVTVYKIAPRRYHHLAIGGRKHRHGPDRARRCCPTMSPSAAIGASLCFRGRRLSPLSPADRRGGAVRPRSSLGLLPDAQSRAPDRDAGGRGWVTGGLCGSAPALHRGHQRSVPMDGPSVPGSLWRGGDGRAAFVGGGVTSFSIRWLRGW